MGLLQNYFEFLANFGRSSNGTALHFPILRTVYCSQKNPLFLSQEKVVFISVNFQNQIYQHGLRVNIFYMLNLTIYRVFNL